MDITLNQQQGIFTLRTAALIIRDNRLLAVKHDHFDGYYTVGGRVHLGESTAEAAVREAYEETGHHFKIDRLLFINEGFFTFEDIARHQVCFCYLMKSETADIPDGQPTDQARERLVWLPIADLPLLPLVPEFLRTALQNLPEQPVHLISRA